MPEPTTIPTTLFLLECEHCHRHEPREITQLFRITVEGIEYVTDRYALIRADRLDPIGPASSWDDDDFPDPMSLAESNADLIRQRLSMTPGEPAYPLTDYQSSAMAVLRGLHFDVRHAVEPQDSMPILLITDPTGQVVGMIQGGRRS